MGGARQTRLGNALADLAHSLKTPLAVLRGALGEGPHPRRPWPSRSGVWMRSSPTSWSGPAGARPRACRRPFPLAPAVERLLAALTKLHADRAVATWNWIWRRARFRGAEGDLLEVIGNLLDNAFKWCRTRVRVGARREAGLLVLWVEDDGPGIPAEQVQDLGERGARADLSAPGHGIGLAVVREICQAYGGDLSIAREPLGRGPGPGQAGGLRGRGCVGRSAVPATRHSFRHR